MSAARCARCGRTITAQEMEDGLVVRTERGLYCGDCAVYVTDHDWTKELRPAAPEGGETDEPRPRRYVGVVGDEADEQEEASPQAPSKPPVSPSPVQSTAGPAEDDPVVLLRSILEELRSVGRAVLYERTSVWNTLGAVAQIFALAVMLFVFARWKGEPDELLLLATFLQLAALTFFVKGK